jgi:RNA polymerase sigma-70 factor (ECF subfamily)
VLRRNKQRHRNTATGSFPLFAETEGPAEPFADFYDHMASAVLGFFARRVRDPQLAFDLTAETFAKAFEKRLTFRGASEGEAASWLWSIARNELAMYSRSKKVERAALERVGIAPRALTDDDLQKVEDLGATEEAREQVRAALAELPPDQREVVRLRYVDELSYHEIAAALGVSHDVVRARASRGLRRLKDSEQLRAAVQVLDQ